MPITYYDTVNGQLVGETTGGVRTEYLTDALGSVTATVNSSGEIVNTYRYKPYGQLLAKTGSGEDPRYLWTGSTGSRKTLVTYAEQYNQARHYGSKQAGWTTVDPLWPDEFAFVYVNSNPVRWTDAQGLQSDPISEWGSQMERCIRDWSSRLFPPEPINVPCKGDDKQRCFNMCKVRNETYVDCYSNPSGLIGLRIWSCICDGCPPFTNLPFCSSTTPGHIIRDKDGHRWGLPIGRLKTTCLDKVVKGGKGTVIPRSGGSIGRNPCSYQGTCNGKPIIVTVGFGRHGPCISDAYEKFR